MTNKTNTGYRNTGDRNTGNRNTGHYNTGHYNTGNCNIGDWNTGHYNTGDRNTGDRNTGDWNTGHYNTGNRNTGHYNTGHCNTGSWNTGHYNTGNRNTGHYNTGHCNTGSWNTGSCHVGCFNTVDAESAYYFNKLLPVAVWGAAYKPNWLFEPTPTTWVNVADMTDEEKAANPSHTTTGGYLRKNDMAEEWRKAYANASSEDIQAVRDLPGFDADVFLEITGLDLRTPDDEITINGVVYVKKA